MTMQKVSTDVHVTLPIGEADQLAVSVTRRGAETIPPPPDCDLFDEEMEVA